MKKICCPNCGVDYSYAIDKIDIDINMDNKNLISGITDLECPFCGYHFKLKLNSMDIINFFAEQAYNNKVEKDNSEKANKTNIKNDMENKNNDTFEFTAVSKTKTSETFNKLEKLLGGYNLADYKINLKAEDNKDNSSTTNNKKVDNTIKAINDKLNNKDYINNIYETFSKLSEIINTENDIKNSGAGTVTKEDNSSDKASEDSNGSNEEEDSIAETAENSINSTYIAPDGSNYEVYHLALTKPFGDFYTQKDLSYILDIIEEILYNLSDICEETDGCENCVLNAKCPYSIEEWLDVKNREERIKSLEILLNNKKEISYIEDFKSRFMEYDIDPLKSGICREAIYKTDGKCPKGISSCKECWEQKYLF